MEAIDLTILATAALVYVVLSARLKRTAVSSAIFFLTAGILLGDAALGWFAFQPDSGVLRLIAESTLALVLFADASRIDLRLLRRELAVPARLLGIGLPLTIIAGALAAFALIPGLSGIEAVLLAIAVAPTDAALGQAVVSDDRVPSRIRQGLNVESGLNDGLCVPLLLIALGVAAAEGGHSDPVRLVVEEIGFGVAGGIVAAGFGWAGMRFGRARAWVDEAWAPLAPIVITGIAYGLATVLHGSGLIAAFAAGLAYGTIARGSAEEATEMIESAADGLSAVTFFVFGAAFVPVMIEGFTWATLAFAVVVLTVGRMLPVAIALIGTRARLPTVLYVGWFGPRGLASIVFAVLILEADVVPGVNLVLGAIVLAVIISVYAHGATARALTDRYVAWHSANRRDAAAGVEEAA